MAVRKTKDVAKSTNDILPEVSIPTQQNDSQPNTHEVQQELEQKTAKQTTFTLQGFKEAAKARTLDIVERPGVVAAVADGNGEVGETKEDVDVNFISASGMARDVKFDHEIFNEKFYSFKLDVERSSGAVDSLYVLTSERTLGAFPIEGCFVEVIGRISSHSIKFGDIPRLLIAVFARDIKPGEVHGKNEVHIVGTISREATPRVTPKGRDIADFTIETHRRYGKRDLVPAIAWGRTAKWFGTLPVGSRIDISGRLQSREYTKYYDEFDEYGVQKVEVRTIYEVSVSRVAVIRKPTSAELAKAQAAIEQSPEEVPDI